jgi:hypothetical protein
MTAAVLSATAPTDQDDLPNGPVLRQQVVGEGGLPQREPVVE